MPQLTWLGDHEAKRTARKVPYRLLDPVEQVGDPSSSNLLIQGDNLEALKALLPFYAGRVKCIYIDPPYNTRSAFEHYDDNLQHSQWLSMMYPRLELLRDLLAEDGSIWVSIDDNEGQYLKVLMDEVFGRLNFATTFVWQKVDSPNDNKVPITPDHEFIFCYERSKDRAGFHKKGDLSLLEAYGGRDDQGRLYRDRLLKKNGKNSLREDRPTMFYPMVAPDGSNVLPIHDDGREANWALSKNGVAKAEAERRLIWKQRDKNGENVWVPYVREYASENPERPHPTILLDVKTSRQAKAHQRDLLPNAELFDTVKPEQLIERVLEISTSPGDVVLDSFLGSGTTAAVAQKMGRRWIGIEMGEHAETHCLPRLQKVIEGEQGGISESVGWQGGGGFRYLKLGEPAFLEDGRINPAIRFATLAAYLWFLEIGAPHPTSRFDSPLLGTHNNTAYILLYNDILGDRRPEGGNVLTQQVWRAILDVLPPHRGPRVIYGEACRLSAARLKQLNVRFRQIPYDIRMR
ncbi:MAG: site-specific DNA-methyltransferase [Betaproteobacteria bacterium]|nr:site-specific DNA-methyltransferase [Betaproteobacteria bacterium]